MQSSSLGNITKNVSPAKQAESRNKRTLLRAHAGELLPGSRVAWCSRRRMHGESQVFYAFSESQHKTSFQNVMVCSSVWTCPICSQRITEQRRQELKKALESKYLPVMITFTLQHDRDELLPDLLDALRDAFRKLKAGKAWLKTKERFHLEHYVTALEVMYGLSAGWHPHLHMLCFLNLESDAFKPEELKQALQERYERLLAKHGKYASDEHGIDVRVGNAGAAEYISKFGIECEITKSPAKLGRGDEHFSPFQLLEQSMNGNAFSGKLFQDYSKAMAGRKQLTWSHGAREAFGLDDELTDEQIVEQLDAQEQDDTIRLLAFGKSTWKKIANNKRLHSGLLMLGNSGDAEAVRNAALVFLELHNIQRIECELRRDLDYEVIADG